MRKKSNFKPEDVRQKIRKLYEEAKKKKEYLPPAVARAKALAILSGGR